MTALDSARPSPTSPSLSPSYVPRGGVPLPAIPRRAPPPRRKMPTPKPSSEAVPQAPSGSSGSIEQQGVKASTESLEIQQTETPAATEPTENPLEKATEGVEETHDEAEIHPPIEEPAHTEVKSEEGDAKYDQLVGEEHAAAEPSVPIEPEEEESHYDPEPKVEVKDQKVEKKEATGGDFDGDVPEHLKSQSIPVSAAPGILGDSASPRLNPPRDGETSQGLGLAISAQQSASLELVKDAEETEEQLEITATADEERERKQRIAERMTKMEAIGFFGQRPPVPPPFRKPTQPRDAPSRASSMSSGIVSPSHARGESQDSFVLPLSPPPASSEFVQDAAAPASAPQRRTSLPPSRRTLPPPPLPLGQGTISASPPPTSPPPAPRSAAPGKRTSLPPARLPPAPPSAPIGGSFIGSRTSSDDHHTTSPGPPTDAQRNSAIYGLDDGEEHGPTLLLEEAPSATLPGDNQEDTEHLRIGELMLSEDTDPIDPAFYSPFRSPSKLPDVDLEDDEQATDTEDTYQHRTLTEPEPPSKHGPQVDEKPEASRKSAFAERMAKLGGISFGVPGGAPPPIRRPAKAVEVKEQPSPQAAEDDEEESEDAARARRAAIAARLAAGGGMRLGMLPGAALPPTVPPPPPPEIPSDGEEEIFEERVEEEACVPGDEIYQPEDEAAEASSDEEAHHLAELNTELAPPPLPPGRHSVPPTPITPSLRQSASPQAFLYGPSSGPVPGVPRILQVDRSSFDAEEIDVPRDRSMSGPGYPTSPTSPVSPRRPPPGKPQGMPDWEYLEEADVMDQDIGTPQVGEDSGRARVIPRTPQELAGFHQRIGTKVKTAADLLVERSAKTVIGDGTPNGFVDMVLSSVPSAKPIDPEAAYFGYLIYQQVGGNITTRVTDIQPGDVVALTDVEFRGFKGLKSYHTVIETQGGPLLGVVQLLEGGKKHKLRVYQAVLQPDTYPSIESASYRLDDLKKGTIQIFRVEES